MVHTRDGNFVIVQGQLTVSSGLPGTSSTMAFNLPDGLTLDTDVMNNGSNSAGSFGHGMFKDGSVYGIICAYISGTVQISFVKCWENGVTTALRGSDLASGDHVTINVRVPVVEYRQ